MGGSLFVARSTMAKFSNVEIEPAGYFSKEANEPAYKCKRAANAQERKLVQTFVISSGDMDMENCNLPRYNTGSITIHKHDVPHHTGKCNNIGGYYNELALWCRYCSEG